MAEHKNLSKEAPVGINAGPVSEDNYYEWEATLSGPAGTPFEDGLFRCRLLFPMDYPLSPPTVRFTSEIFHPNIYPDGLVCISILHQPGNDPTGYEKSYERWSPVQSVEKVLLSVLSLLSEPNLESPANLDAAVMWRNHKEEYDKKARSHARRTLQEK